MAARARAAGAGAHVLGRRGGDRGGPRWHLGAEPGGGFAGIIEKPFELDALEVAVAGIVNGAAAGASAAEPVRIFRARN